MFKNIKTGILDQFSSSDIEEVHWLVRARGHCLKFILNSGNIHRFDGLKETVSDQYVCCYDKGGKVSGVFIVPKKSQTKQLFCEVLMLTTSTMSTFELCDIIAF